MMKVFKPNGEAWRIIDDTEEWGSFPTTEGTRVYAVTGPRYGGGYIVAQLDRGSSEFRVWEGRAECPTYEAARAALRLLSL